MKSAKTRRFPRILPGSNSTIAVLILTALLFLSIGCQKTEPRKQSSPEELAEQASNLVSGIEETRQELARLESELSTARSDRQEALEFQYTSRKRRLLKDVSSLVENITQLDAIGQDTGASRFAAEAVLIQDLESAEEVLDKLETSIAQLREARRNSDLPGRPDLDLRLASRHSELNLAYTQSRDTIELLETLGTEVQTRISPRLPALLWRHAEVLAGRVELHSEHAREIRTRLAEAPDAPELKALSDESEVAFSRDILNLESLVGLMDKLELDTSLYKAILLRSGQISTKTVDQNILRTLLERWGDDLASWFREKLPEIFIHLLVFLMTVAVFWGIAALVQRLVSLVVRRMDLSQLLKRMLISTVSRAVLLLGILVALMEMGVELGPLLAGLAIAGFIVGFALQDSLSNFASGLMILSYRPFDVGDVIEAGGALGKVSSMSLVSTTILTFDNQTMIVPNNKIWQDVIKNVTAQDIRRVDMVFGISYEDDIPRAEQVLAGILEDNEKVLDDPPAVVRLHNLGDSSVDFIVRPWARTADYWEVFWEVTRQVKLRFDQEGISIPFPQRDVHVYAAPKD